MWCRRPLELRPGQALSVPLINNAMKSFLLLILATAILPAPSAPAADPQSQIGAPVLGYVFDPAVKGIRPVIGIPGASIIGNPLDRGFSVASAVISPRQDFAIATVADNAAVRILMLQPGNFHSQILAAVAGVPQKIIFSPSGQTAGLYQQDQAKLQIFTQLPEEPALAHEIDLTGLTGDLLSAAVSDDGDLALILTGDQVNSILWLSYAGTGPVQLQVPSATSAISFRSGSHDAVLATRDGQIDLLQNLSSGLDLLVLAPPDERTADPVAVQFSPDGARAYVVTQQGMVAEFGIQSQGATFLSCGCKPSGLSPLRSPMLMRLNEISDGPLMLLDTALSEPRIWFVPAVIAAAGSGRRAQ